ncbi:MAG: dTDP-4-dehydrorhamnose reductase [uncultured Chloroflexi bacterium]|uniref:dTDP-4-dehydrorhamnose reductase n=1 Tax=uncultured Chloroflexota bacterium TaxID=166587 RepID=A0A6J4H0R4_9CHLR|nr:MAG: dTDP-4-dehydrorhamnose reductase [uncultured Chloroflexota bacterium]
MEIAVLTANSQLGRALVPELERIPGWRVRPLLRRDLDITDVTPIARLFESPPAVLINTAFWATEDPEPALRVNALGPRLLAERCAAAGTLLVQVSTDYVFDGEADRPYRETDPTAPRSVYGISKLAGEHLVRAAAPDHLIVRVSGLYGPGGSRAKGGTNFVSDMIGMARAGKAIRVVTDQLHSPTYAPDAATTIRQLISAGVRGTVHVSNTGACSKYDFAARSFELAGLAPDLHAITLADLPPLPPRPRYTVLAHDALHAAGLPSPRPWQDALADYVRWLGENGET